MQDKTLGTIYEELLEYTASNFDEVNDQAKEFIICDSSGGIEN